MIIFVVIEWSLSLIHINDAQVKELAFFGYSYNFNDICLIYPLKIQDKVALGHKYEQLIGLITIHRVAILANLEEKEIDTKEFENINVIEYLTRSCYYNESIEKDIKAALRLLTHEEDITILYEQGEIYFGDFKDLRVLNGENFPYFQNIVRLQNGLDIDYVPNEQESPRMKRFREKAALRDYYKNKQPGSKDSGQDFLKTLSTLCIYLQSTPNQIENLSILAYISLLSLAQKRESFKTEVSFRAGGAEIKTPMKHWTEK